MVKFEFEYEDGKFVACPNIIKASYVGSSSRIDVKEEELLSHAFPLIRDFWLKAEDTAYSVSHQGLRAIHISEE